MSSKTMVDIFVLQYYLSYIVFYHNKCDTVYLLFFPPYTTKLD